MRLRHELGDRLTPGARASLISWIAVGLALIVLGWSLLQTWNVSLAVAAFLAVVCAIVISRVSMQTIGVVLIAMFCFTASWDQTSLAGIKVTQLFLALGGLMLATGIDPRRLPPVPWWLHAYGVSAVVVVILQTLFPIDASYLDERYAVSATGQSLGERPSALWSLGSLLLNNYAVPLVVVVACMYAPRALRWLIGAYVLGAAMSCAAAILGFYGQPAIINLFGGLPAPEGVRAAGFTSHSLRLATSGVMAIGLACWMALQPQHGLKWAGRISVPVLILGLYVSGSRGGIVSSMLVLILAMLLLPDIRNRIHVVVSAVGAGLLGLYFLLPTTVVEGVLGQTRILGGESATRSDIGRSQLLDQGLQDFKESPIFGIGGRFLAEAHTLYVGVLAAGGIIFAVGYVLFNIGSLRASIQAVKVDRSLGGALLATLIASLWYWTVADLIQTKTVAIVYGFVIALWWQGHHDKAVSAWGEQRPVAVKAQADGSVKVAGRASRMSGRT